MINEHLRKYTIALQFGFQLELWIWNQSQRIVVHLTRIYRERLVLLIKFDSENENPVARPVAQGIQASRGGSSGTASVDSEYRIQESGGSSSETVSENSEYPDSLPDLVPIQHID